MLVGDLEFKEVSVSCLPILKLALLCTLNTNGNPLHDIKTVMNSNNRRQVAPAPSMPGTYVFSMSVSKLYLVCHELMTLNTPTSYMRGGINNQYSLQTRNSWDSMSWVISV